MDFGEIFGDRYLVKYKCWEVRVEIWWIGWIFRWTLIFKAHYDQFKISY